MHVNYCTLSLTKVTFRSIPFRCTVTWIGGEPIYICSTAVRRKFAIRDNFVPADFTFMSNRLLEHFKRGDIASFGFQKNFKNYEVQVMGYWRYHFSACMLHIYEACSLNCRNLKNNFLTYEMSEVHFHNEVTALVCTVILKACTIKSTKAVCLIQKSCF